MRHVILPHGMWRIVPAHMNMLVAPQKDVAVLSSIGPVETLRHARIFKSLPANCFFYSAPALVSLVLTVPVPRDANHLMNTHSNAQSQNGLAQCNQNLGRRQRSVWIGTTFGPREIACTVGTSGSGQSMLLRSMIVPQPVGKSQVLVNRDDIVEPGVQPDPDPTSNLNLGLVVQPVPKHDSL